MRSPRRCERNSSDRLRLARNRQGVQRNLYVPGRTPAKNPCALRTHTYGPSDVAVDARGNVYVLDELNFRVLKLPIP